MCEIKALLHDRKFSYIPFEVATVHHPQSDHKSCLRIQTVKKSFIKTWNNVYRPSLRDNYKKKKKTWAYCRNYLDLNLKLELFLKSATKARDLIRNLLLSRILLGSLTERYENCKSERKIVKQTGLSTICRGARGLFGQGLLRPLWKKDNTSEIKNPKNYTILLVP